MRHNAGRSIKMKKRYYLLGTAIIIASLFGGCGKQEQESAVSVPAETKESLSNEEIIIKAAHDGKVGNWGLGN